MAKERRILFLTLHTFSLTGGIEKVCRIFSKVLKDLIAEKQLVVQAQKVLSLCDRQADISDKYVNATNFKGYNYNRLYFGLSAVFNGFRSEVIVLSHINLIPIAYLIKLVSRKKRIVLFAHGIEVWRDLPTWKKDFLRLQVEIWAVSNHTRQVLEEKHQIQSKNISILNNCLDPYFDLPKKFEKPQYLLDRLKINKNQPIILTISRFSSHDHYKGYDHVLKALPALLHTFPDLVYILGGKTDDIENKRLKMLIKKEGLERSVILTNFILDHELVDFFLMADVFAMPSKKEGFGIVFIEAAACGCPVIAGNQDGSTDALLNGELGTLINSNDIHELSEAIQQSIKNKKSPASSLQQQQKCIANFSYEKYKQKVDKLLKLQQ